MHRRNEADEWSDEAHTARPSIAMTDPMRDIEMEEERCHQ